MKLHINKFNITIACFRNTYTAIMKKTLTMYVKASKRKSKLKQFCQLINQHCDTCACSFKSIYKADSCIFDIIAKFASFETQEFLKQIAEHTLQF